MKPPSRLLSCRSSSRRWALALALAGLGFGQGWGAEPAPKREFSDFRILYERNIFNPNRRLARRDAPERPRPVRTETFALKGTLISEQGAYAFFDGSEAEYRKAVQPTQRIARFHVVAITANAVKLQAADKTLELAVGRQMRREDQGEWRMASATETWTPAPAVASTDKPTESQSGSGAGEDEVLKRLLQKREKEVGQ